MLQAPAIIFIDELDAIGQKRSGGGELSGGQMLQRSCVYQLRLVVDIPLFYKGFIIHPRWLALGFLNHQQYEGHFCSLSRAYFRSMS